MEHHPQITEVSLKIAAELGVPRSGHAGEQWMGMIYGTEPDQKEGTYAEILENLAPGGVGTHRIAEFATLTSPRIRAIVERRGIELLSYRDLGTER